MIELGGLIKYINIKSCMVYIIRSLTGFYKHIKIIRKGYAVSCIFYNRKRNKLLFLGHIDTVSEGEIKRWVSFPYTNVIRKNRYIARGMCDMKGALYVFIKALTRYSKDNDIACVISGDEETTSISSMIAYRYIRKHNIHIDNILIGEPTGLIKERIGIRFARRGSLNICVKIDGKQGHMAYDDDALNPYNRICYPIEKVIKYRNKKNAINVCYIQSRRYSGYNVIPRWVKIFINIRYANRHYANYIMKNIIHVRYQGYQVNIKRTGSATLYRNILHYLGDDHPCVNVIYKGGVSDGRIFRRLISKAGIICEVGLSNNHIHKINERVSVYDIPCLFYVYKNIILTKTLRALLVPC
ncbi:M20/M25/M40 family metallo-hydrolase [Candidatus Vidania fulgoroideorum]